MKIGRLPKGYMYPELHSKDSIPRQLRQVMMRKWHFKESSQKDGSNLEPAKYKGQPKQL